MLWSCLRWLLLVASYQAIRVSASGLGDQGCGPSFQDNIIMFTVIRNKNVPPVYRLLFFVQPMRNLNSLLKLFGIWPSGRLHKKTELKQLIFPLMILFFVVVCCSVSNNFLHHLVLKINVEGQRSVSCLIGSSQSKLIKGEPLLKRVNQTYNSKLIKHIYSYIWLDKCLI